MVIQCPDRLSKKAFFLLRSSLLLMGIFLSNSAGRSKNTHRQTKMKRIHNKKKTTTR